MLWTGGSSWGPSRPEFGHQPEEGHQIHKVIRNFLALRGASGSFLRSDFKCRKRTRLSAGGSAAPAGTPTRQGVRGVHVSHPPAGLAGRPRSVLESPGPPSPLPALAAAGPLSSSRPRPVPSSVRGRLADHPQLLPDTGEKPCTARTQRLAFLWLQQAQSPRTRVLCGAELPECVGAREPGAPEGQAAPRPRTAPGCGPPSPPPHPAGPACVAAALSPPHCAHRQSCRHTRSHRLTRSESHTFTRTHAHTHTLRVTHIHTHTRTRSHV